MQNSDVVAGVRIIANEAVEKFPWLSHLVAETAIVMNRGNHALTTIAWDNPILMGCNIWTDIPQYFDLVSDETAVARIKLSAATVEERKQRTAFAMKFL